MEKNSIFNSYIVTVYSEIIYIMSPIPIRRKDIFVAICKNKKVKERLNSEDLAEIKKLTREHIPKEITSFNQIKDNVIYIVDQFIEKRAPFYILLMKETIVNNVCAQLEKFVQLKQQKKKKSIKKTKKVKQN